MHVNAAVRKLGRKLLPAVAAERAITFGRGVREHHDIPRVARDATARLGRSVLAGPFVGMTLLPGFEENAAAPIAKLLGQYECGLHDTIERVIAASPAVVVNVGCSDGYYTVGLARRLPGATVLAHDIARTARTATAELALLNGVEDRVVVHGRCRNFPDGRILVVCDIDGGEDALLKPELLAEATVIVETHDGLVPGVTDRLRERFTRSHQIETIEEAEPDGTALSWMSEADRGRALSELRTEKTPWLLMTPRL